MLFTCYLRDGIVYVPTVARRKSEPIYTNIEPVAVVPLSSTEDLRRALLETIAKKMWSYLIAIRTLCAPHRCCRNTLV